MAGHSLQFDYCVIVVLMLYVFSSNARGHSITAQPVLMIIKTSVLRHAIHLDSAWVSGWFVWVLLDPSIMNIPSYRGGARIRLGERAGLM